MDKRVLRRWAAARPPTPGRYLGVDEIFLGKIKFLTVVSDLETREPLWDGPGTQAGDPWTGSSPRRCRPPPPPRRAGRVRGHVGAVRAEPAGAPAPRPARLRQVPRPAPRRRGGR